MTTIDEDLAALRRLADRLDPDIPWDASPAALEDIDVADMLRRTAAHLERITSGGDRPTPAQLVGGGFTSPNVDPPVDTEGGG